MKGIHLIAIATVFLASTSVINAEKEEFDKIPTKCPAKDSMNTTIHLAHESDCTKFYMCHAGRKILQQCPYMNDKGDRLHFNPRLQVCDWPDRAGCEYKKSDQNQDEEHNGIARTVNVEYKCPDRNTGNETILLPHESDCTKFYMCLGRQKIEKDCPFMNDKGDRLHFNPVLKVCDWPDKAGCEDKGTPGDDECPCDGFLIRHECNCAKYYKCAKGEKVLRECPKDLYFSQEEQGCVKFEESDCKKESPYKCTREGELIPHECDCTKYYKCREKDRVLRQCKNGLHFSPERRKCEDKDKAGCIKPPRIRIGDCPRPIPKHPWRHECDCRLFYKCENGKKRLYECPWKYYFDVKKDGCSRLEYVTDCKNSWDKSVEDKPYKILEELAKRASDAHEK